MKRRYQALVAGTLALGVAFAAVHRSGEPTAQAVSRPVVPRLVARAGVVSANGTAEVRALVSGRVSRVLVREGDRVERGQVLAELESDTLPHEVAQRVAERDAQAARVALLSSGARAQEIGAADADVVRARADLAHAKQAQQKAEALAQSGAGPETSVIDAKHAVVGAETALRAAESRLSILRAGPRAEALREARAMLAAAEAVLAAAVDHEKRATIVAPRAGVVIGRAIDAGDGIGDVATAPALFEIADPNDVELRAEVEEIDAARVTEGMAARVRSIFDGKIVAEGSVTRVAARLERRRIGANDARERADALVRAAWIRVDWKGGPPPMGARYEVFLTLPPVAARCVVPRDAVVIRDGAPTVDVAWGPLFRAVPVRLGASDEEGVEVIGLASGVRVRRHG